MQRNIQNKYNEIILCLINFNFFKSCSFDNKTGIWKNENTIKKEKDIFKDFKKLSSKKFLMNNTYKKILI